MAGNRKGVEQKGLKPQGVQEAKGKLEDGEKGSFWVLIRTQNAEEEEE